MVPKTISSSGFHFMFTFPHLDFIENTSNIKAMN